MALIATVYPYKNENNMSYNHRKQSSSSASTDREQPYSGIFRIEDVTDDPRVSFIFNFLKIEPSIYLITFLTKFDVQNNF